MAEARPDPWNDLKSLTSARIALGRAGGSLPTRELLDFGLAHASARDAVMASLDTRQLATEFQSAGLKTLELSSKASTRDEFLRRPDLGRQLSEDSRLALSKIVGSFPSCDLVPVVSGGLSAHATQQHSSTILIPLLSRLSKEGWRIAPVVLVAFGRVAIEDEIGEILGATLALILLGERPGLGAPDSLGAYFVHGPNPGRTDGDRNCVSNIRPGGLPVDAAVDTLTHLLMASRHRKISGVSLKDERLLNGPTSSVRSISGR